MLRSLRDFIGARVTAGDRDGEVRDAFFRAEDGVICYVALDFGGWWQSDTIIVSTELLSPPEENDESWRVALGEAELENAPRWIAEDHSEGMDLRHWPPVIVEPFGSTVSPILLYEQLQERETEAEVEPKEIGRADRLTRYLQRAGQWLGLPAFDATGEIGRIQDMDFDPESRRILAFVLEGPAPLPSRGAQIPYVALRYMADQKTHLVFGPIQAFERPAGGVSR